MGVTYETSSSQESDKMSSTAPPEVVEVGASSNHETEEPKALSETKPAWAVLLVALGILMSLFLVALDRTIVSTVSLLIKPP